MLELGLIIDESRRRRAWTQLACVLLSLWLSSSHAWAHPEGFSGMRVVVDAEHIRIALTLHTRDLGTWFPPGKYPDYVADVIRDMERNFADILEVRIDEQPLVIDSVRAFLLEVGLIEIDVQAKLPQSKQQVELLVWSKHLIYLPRGHQQLLFIEDRRSALSETEAGIVRLEETLTIERDAGAVLLPPNRAAEVISIEVESPGSSAVALPTETRQPISEVASAEPTSRISFFVFGIEHILTGYDHLLFLAALLLVCTRLQDAATIITCFTVAHSITLALAALDLIRLPMSMVEPAIALSIVYVALENLLGTPSLGRRMAITCGFGLIHGLGFASALREIGLASLPGGVVWPLLKFNLGVETGQMIVAGIFFPLMLLARRTERSTSILLHVGSILVAALGAYWFASRMIAAWISS